MRTMGFREAWQEAVRSCDHKLIIWMWEAEQIFRKRVKLTINVSIDRKTRKHPRAILWLIRNQLVKRMSLITCVLNDHQIDVYMRMVMKYDVNADMY